MKQPTSKRRASKKAKVGGIKKHRRAANGTKNGQSNGDVKKYSALGKGGENHQPFEKNLLGIRTKHLKDIAIESRPYGVTCRVTSMALLPNNRLVFTDQRNKQLILADTKRDAVVSQKDLVGMPWAVCKASDTSVAVTIHDEGTISFIEIGHAGKLKLSKDVTVDGKCRGVAIAYDRMYVTFRFPDSLKIMTMDGTVLHNIMPISNNKRLLNYPQHVVMGTDNQTIYVSNLMNHDVVCFNLGGEVLNVYKDKQLKHTEQACFDSRGFLYVTGHVSENVHMITTDCKKIKVLLDKSDGLEKMYAVSYCENRNRLYIGLNDNKIKVFQLS